MMEMIYPFSGETARAVSRYLSQWSRLIYDFAAQLPSKKGKLEREIYPLLHCIFKRFFYRRNSKSSTSSLSVSSSEDSLPRYCVVAILSTDPFTILEAQNSKA